MDIFTLGVTHLGDLVDLGDLGDLGAPGFDDEWALLAWTLVILGRQLWMAIACHRAIEVRVKCLDQLHVQTFEVGVAVKWAWHGTMLCF